MFPALFLLAALAFPAPAQVPDAEAAAGEAGPAGVFSAAALIRAARGADLAWRPDWPAAVPPDAFTLWSGRFSSLTVILETGEYRVRPGEGGFLAEFPVLMGGVLYPAAAEFTGGELAGIRVGGGASLEFAFSQPLRVTRGDGVYFVALDERGGRTYETWYDQEGNALAVIQSPSAEAAAPEAAEASAAASAAGDALINTPLDGGEETAERRDHDSSGRITGVVSPGGNFSALYDRKGRPRYWRRGDGAYTFQWDERGLLTRITGDLDSRYEYTLDARGNWTERREIPLIRSSGFLLPAPGPAVKRIILYAPEDEVPGQNAAAAGEEP
jgi:hypothetical protein